MNTVFIADPEPVFFPGSDSFFVKNRPVEHYFAVNKKIKLIEVVMPIFI
jgi:hypothetical protein